MTKPTKDPIAGITTEGRPVVKGSTIFDLYQTHGLPMEVIVDQCFERGFEIDFFGLYSAFLDSGVRPSKIMSLIEESLMDVEKSKRDAIISRLKRLV